MIEISNFPFYIFINIYVKINKKHEQNELFVNSKSLFFEL
jgi:hypothetical protein